MSFETDYIPTDNSPEALLEREFSKDFSKWKVKQDFTNIEATGLSCAQFVMTWIKKRDPQNSSIFNLLNLKYFTIFRFQILNLLITNCTHERINLCKEEYSVFITQTFKILHNKGYITLNHVFMSQAIMYTPVLYFNYAPLLLAKSKHDYIAVTSVLGSALHASNYAITKDLLNNIQCKSKEFASDKFKLLLKDNFTFKLRYKTSKEVQGLEIIEKANILRMCIAFTEKNEAHLNQQIAFKDFIFEEVGKVIGGNKGHLPYLKLALECATPAELSPRNYTLYLSHIVNKTPLEQLNFCRLDCEKKMCLELMNKANT